MAKQSESPKKEKDDELTVKVMYINRCSKVVKGGRKFSFSALIVVGNGKGKVGCGFGKGNELTDAISKGEDAARKNIITCAFEGTTIPYEMTSRCDGATLLFKPAPPGTGIIAGTKPGAVLELAGYKDVMIKNLGARNPVNQVYAAFKALKQFIPREEVMQMRGTNK
ncbi:MAG: 30S ribosomal protein S5 [Parachlamydiaceae bacterium]|nr:30S ribosomal protein S5 [Parachlamydiaceae bacterium]